MKKLFIWIAILSCFITFGQHKEKIKGNREVLIKKFTVPKFTALEVGEKFEIGLQKSIDTTRVIIETDDNLFDVIHFNVSDGILSFRTSKEIVKKKRLKVTIFVPEDFSRIKLSDKAQVYNEEDFRLKNLKIEALKRSQFKLNLDIASDLEIYLRDKSVAEFEGTTKNAKAELSESSQLKYKGSIKKINAKLNDYGIIKLKGFADEGLFNLEQKSEFKGKDFIVKNAKLQAKDKTVSDINVSNHLDLKASGESEVSIYNQPKINLKLFKDHAILYKK